MDVHLKKSLIKSYHFLRKYPCFMQNLARPIYERVSTLPVMVQFKNELTDTKVNSIIECIGSPRFSITKILPMINCITLKVCICDLKKLCDHEAVSRIYLDRKVHTTLDIATPSIGSVAAQQAGLTGNGVTIAVIDTGIYPHPDLTEPVNRIIAFKDFIQNRTTPYDDNGHGTHVAGDAAGNGRQSGGIYLGPAPEANLVGVKVLNKQGYGQLSTVIAGVEWCIENRDRFGIRIISMSLGSSGTSSCADDPLCQAVEKAWNNDLVVVVAAGNEGPGAGTISSPGISPSAITVGATDDHGTIKQSDDTVADFSSCGPTPDGVIKPDIVSPGVAITSLRSPRSFLDKTNPDARVGTWYFTLSGTSMATPIVSGTVAQILQQNPNLKPDQVKSLFIQNAVDLGFDPNTQGSGEVNVNFLT